LKGYTLKYYHFPIFLLIDRSDESHHLKIFQSVAQTLPSYGRDSLRSLIAFSQNHLMVDMAATTIESMDIHFLLMEESQEEVPQLLWVIKASSTTLYSIIQRCHHQS
jgi:hypothetical protein